MIDIELLRQHPEEIKQGAKKKGVDIDIDQILKIDKQRRELIQEVEELKAKKNKISKKQLTEEEIQEAKKIKERIKEVEPELEKIEEQFNKMLLLIPNPPLKTAPEGKDEEDNKVIREEGKKPKFKFKPKDYLTIAENLDIIDTKRAAKVSGSRFGYLKGAAVLLEIALIQLTMEELRKENFIPIIPPAMIRPEMMQAMGYVERGGDEIYHTAKDDLYLIGTSEQSIGPMHANETIEEKEMPKRYAAFSPCFRREAGSYGKDTKGILRVHQFDKIEMFSFCMPTESETEHKEFLKIQERLMNLLKLPYRVLNICTGDLGDPAAAKFDIETWMPGQKEYRETHSTSNCTDFQARRLNIKYKRGDKQNFVHTVNGTAFAIGRIIISIIENYQKENGTIEIPKKLRKYINLKEIK
ncbi:MAG: serine--tRNA ligase [Candidatus Portnoybacteria bacterium]|nr:serine--tRNA ligase [Candidatus Portnoybacteria bacterium]